MDETAQFWTQIDCHAQTISCLERIAVNVPGMIFQFLLKPDGSRYVFYVSSGSLTLCELAPSVIKSNWQVLETLVHPDDIKTWAESMAIAAASVTPWRWQGRIITPRGEVKWIDSHAQLQLQANGDLLWDGLVMDITDRKQVQAQLQTTQARYQAILNAQPDFMFCISRDGEYLDLKGDGENITLSRAEIIGRSLQDVLPRDVAAISQEIIHKTLDTGSLQICEYQLPTPLGVRDYEARFVVSGDDEVLAIVRDITERKAAESTLENLAQKFSKAFNCSPDPITISTLKEGRYVEVNDSFVRLSGYERDQAVGCTDLELNIWVNESDRTQLLQKLQTQGVVNNAQFAFRRKSGEVITSLISAEVIDLDGIPHILAINHDITAELAIATQQVKLYQELADLNANLEQQVEERTAQLQQKMQELAEIHRIKEVVLHTVAHDLRTSVMGNLMVLKNLLGNGDRDKEAGEQGSREKRGNSSPLHPAPCPNSSSPMPHAPSQITVPKSIIERMIQGSDRQLGMLDSLLEIHACQEQGMILHRELVSFSHLFERITRDLQLLLSQNQATIKNLLSVDLPLVMVDVGKLQKVLLNLFTHSLLHNPPGLNFIIKATVENGMIRTCIQENGINLSKLECDRLFDLYIRDPQASCSTAISLKMYLCRQIIQAHGGEIGVIRHRQRGLTFWFTLPFDK
ncbi:MAG: PAS domain S-box protein [Trichormus sp.]